MTLEAGDAENLSEPLLVAADHGRLVMNARNSGSELFSTHVPVTLRRGSHLHLWVVSRPQQQAAGCQQWRQDLANRGALPDGHADR